MGYKYKTDREVALLLIINALSYGQEKEKVVTRYRIGTDSFRMISDRSTLRDSFLQDVTDQVSKLGWVMATLPEGDGYAIFKADIVDKWAGLGSKRLKEEGLLDMNENELETYYDNLIKINK